MRKTIKQLESELVAAKAEAAFYKLMTETLQKGMIEAIKNPAPDPIWIGPYVAPQPYVPQPWYYDIWCGGQTGNALPATTTITCSGVPLTYSAVRVSS
jgi:hypothetical protein